MKSDNESYNIGTEMYELMKELFPICRSITGNGVRKTLQIISKQIPLKIHEVPTGKKMFDWETPKEWNIKDAYIKTPSGEKIVDFQKSNLHVVSYSTAINKKISLNELKNHIQTLPNRPDLIPYHTTYYNENWGFCMTHKQFLELKEGEYEVYIDSKLENGSLTYGEFLVTGKSKEEILITCYVCHPSLCNDSLSGVALVTYLAKKIQKLDNYYSIRFLFIPETIGAITWLASNEEKLSQIKYGLVVTCVGTSAKFTYKKSRKGTSILDKTVIDVLESSGMDNQIVDFFPYGSDERQFCSPGINLSVGSLYRSENKYLEFPEYHSSGDNFSIITKEALEETFSVYFKIILQLEKNRENKFEQTETNFEKNKNKDLMYLNLFPKCEPQLSKRGLYRTIGGTTIESDKEIFNQLAYLWILNYSDGKYSLKDIADISKIDLEVIRKSAILLENKKLLKKI